MMEPFISNKEFRFLWNGSPKLGCPKLRFCTNFLYPKHDDPCTSGDCNMWACHNYKLKFDEDLVRPKKPIPKLIVLTQVGDKQK
jgi:hypothetical protein